APLLSPPVLFPPMDGAPPAGAPPEVGAPPDASGVPPTPAPPVAGSPPAPGLPPEPESGPASLQAMSPSEKIDRVVRSRERIGETIAPSCSASGRAVIRARMLFLR